MNSKEHRFNRQQGASLIIGLILLLVLSVLAVSTMGGASLELAMSGNRQFGENAFQMAETGVDRSLTSGPFSTSVPTVVPLTAVAEPVSGRQIGTYQANTQFRQDTPPPGGGYSLGNGSGFRAYHFQTLADGTSARNAAERHTQEFYVIGPGGP
jgi:type IV pilus assembly protein PilX